MEKVMKKEFIEYDLPLAMSCLASIVNEPKAAHLVPKFRGWVESLQAQLKTYYPE